MTYNIFLGKTGYVYWQTCTECMYTCICTIQTVSAKDITKELLMEFEFAKHEPLLL